ncbi:MAG TPA: DUF3857 domain-containing protein, partial [Rhizomicrobium sp.]|nr:DUF3857 domain-containing protein [Rhizomicrobium sp.]
MNMVLRRAARVVLASLFVLVAGPLFAQDWDYSYDDTPDAIGQFFDLARLEPAPTDAALPGVPAQALDFALAQSPATSAAAGVPARFLAVDNRFDVHADGSSTITSHVEIQLLSPQAVSALAQPALTFSDTMQDLQIRNAYTLKRDGTRLPVAPDAILVRQKAVPSPMFTDLKEKVILFPNVEPGDTLVYDTVT